MKSSSSTASPVVSPNSSLSDVRQYFRTSLGSNSRDPRFFEFLSTLGQLSDLPFDHDFHVDSKTAKLASLLVAYLSDNYEVEIPRLLPESKECLSLTWEDSSFKKFLSLYEDAVDLTQIFKPMKLSCHEFLSEDLTVDFDRIGKVLSKSGRAKSKTEA